MRHTRITGERKMIYKVKNPFSVMIKFALSFLISFSILIILQINVSFSAFTVMILLNLVWSLMTIEVEAQGDDV